MKKNRRRRSNSRSISNKLGLRKRSKSANSSRLDRRNHSSGAQNNSSRLDRRNHSSGAQNNRSRLERCNRSSGVHSNNSRRVRQFNNSRCNSNSNGNEHSSRFRPPSNSNHSVLSNSNSHCALNGNRLMPFRNELSNKHVVGNNSADGCSKAAGGRVTIPGSRIALATGNRTIALGRSAVDMGVTTFLRTVSP